MSSFTYPYLPYFYIITHKRTNIKYAGSRWNKAPTKFSKHGCHPSELLHTNGYFTSSKTIHRILNDEGINSFEITLIVTSDDLHIPFGCDSVYDYETWFLMTNNCASSNEWYNKHNNSYQIITTMINQYGVDNPSKSVYLKAKRDITYQKTLQTKYGVDHIMQVPYVIEKAKQQRTISLNETYGVDNVFQLDKTKAKITQSFRNRYGVDHYAQTPEKRKISSDFNKTLKTCKYCDSTVSHASYMSKHGKFCTQNPNRIIKRNPVPMCNILTGEIRVIEKHMMSFDWLVLNKNIFTVYDSKGNVIAKNQQDLKSFCITNNYPYSLFATAGRNKQRINTRHTKYLCFNGWRIDSQTVKDFTAHLRQ